MKKFLISTAVALGVANAAFALTLEQERKWTAISKGGSGSADQVRCKPG